MEAHLLSICIGLPLCSALVAVLWDDAVWVYRCALVGAVGAALIALSLVVGFEPSRRAGIGSRNWALPIASAWMGSLSFPSR